MTSMFINYFKDQGKRMFNQVKNVGLLGYEKRLRSVLNFIFCQSDAKLKYHMIKI